MVGSHREDRETHEMPNNVVVVDCCLTRVPGASEGGGNGPDGAGGQRPMNKRSHKASRRWAAVDLVCKDGAISIEVLLYLVDAESRYGGDVVTFSKPWARGARSQCP